MPFKIKKSWITIIGCIYALILMGHECDSKEIDTYLINDKKVFYIANNGNDRWSGELPEPNITETDGPFETLERGRNVVRLHREKDPNIHYEIVVRGGIYHLEKTLELAPVDSGTKSKPLIIRAFDGERPILSGTKKIIRFERGVGNVYEADLNNTVFKKKVFSQLFVKNKRQVLSRFPNIDNQSEINNSFLYVDRSLVNNSKKMFHFNKEDLKDKKYIQFPEIIIYPGPNYWNNIRKINKIDYKNGVVHLDKEASYSIIEGNRYYLQNVKAELDSPGEWYFDKLINKLYFYPKFVEDLDSVTLPVLNTIVAIKTISYRMVRNIRIEGFELRGCSGDAIVLSNAMNIKISNCRVYNTGGNGIVIKGGGSNCVFGCELYDIGMGGIIVRGGNLKTITSASNRVENNHLYRIGSIYKASAAIDCNGVGNIVSHNLIHNTPRAGIKFNGNNHIIEYNYIHHVNQETQDSGAIYICARDWTKRGNIIRFNYINDSGGFGRNNHLELWKKPFKTWGIYLDDWTSGVKVYSNIINNTASGGIFIHGGRDNLIENNIVVNGGKGGPMVYSAWLPDHKFAKKMLPTMYEKIKKKHYDKYPELKSINSITSGAKMSGNKFIKNILIIRAPNNVLYSINKDIDMKSTVSDYNVISAGREKIIINMPGKYADVNQWEEWLNKGKDTHSILADPLFKDMDKYILASESPAFKLGFKQIPFMKIGLYKQRGRNSNCSP